MNRDGENSPARLTMAQAALLNLQGTRLSSDGSMPRLPNPNFHPSSPMQTNIAIPPLPYLQSPLPPPIGLHNQQVLQNYPALGRLQVHRNDDFNSQAADYVSTSLFAPSQMLGSDEDLTPGMLNVRMAMGGVGNGATRAQDGFTAMEKLILQAHEQQQRDASMLTRIQQQALASGLNASAADFRPAGNYFDDLQPSSSSMLRAGGRRLTSILPSMSEEDFHATGGGHRSATSPNVESVAIFSPRMDQSPSGLAMDLNSRLNFTRQRNQTHAEARAQAQADAQAQALHIRSTTVPSHYLTSDRSNTQALLNTRNINDGHQTMNGSAEKLNYNLDPKSRDITQVRTNRLNDNLFRNPNDADFDRRTSLTGIKSARDAGTSSFAPNKTRTNGVSDNHLRTRIDTALHGNKVTSLARGGIVHNAHEDDDEGSGQDSPALSYSTSVRTPASLSPATPFSAFGETFEGPQIANVAGVGGELGLGMGSVAVAANLKQKMRAVE